VIPEAERDEDVRNEFDGGGDDDGERWERRDVISVRTSMSFCERVMNIGESWARERKWNVMLIEAAIRAAW